MRLTIAIPYAPKILRSVACRNLYISLIALIAKVFRMGLITEMDGQPLLLGIAAANLGLQDIFHQPNLEAPFPCRNNRTGTSAKH
jgi:hypothetical protein